MRTFPFIAILALSACTQEPPVIEFSPTIVVEVPQEEPPTIIVEVTEDASSDMLDCEPIVGMNGFPQYGIVEVLDDLVFVGNMADEWSVDDGTLRADFLLSTFQGCAPVFIDGVSMEIEMFSVEPVALDLVQGMSFSDSFRVVHHDDNDLSREIGATPGDEIAYTDLGQSIGGTRNAKLFIDASTGSFPVEPEVTEHFSFEFDGLHRLPKNEGLTVTFLIFYSAVIINDDGELEERRMLWKETSFGAYVY